MALLSHFCESHILATGKETVLALTMVINEKQAGPRGECETQRTGTLLREHRSDVTPSGSKRYLLGEKERKGRDNLSRGLKHVWGAQE